MPLVRISLREGRPEAYRKAVGEGVHRAMVETIDVPEHDRFQIITGHDSASLIYDRTYLGIDRSDDTVLIQLTISAGRSLEKKRALYARIVALLMERPGVRPQDVFINLVEVAPENWSFGNGVAQYAG